MALREVGQADELEVALDRFAPLRHADAPGPRADLHVSVDGHPRHQGRVLHHDGPVRPGAVDALPLEQDLALAGLKEARDQMEQGRLAAARRADQANEVALVDRQVDVSERVDDLRARPVPDIDLPRLEKRSGHRRQALPAQGTSRRSISTTPWSSASAIAPITMMPAKTMLVRT